MADKEMTLMMQIKARADQFHIEFAKAEKAFKNLQDRAETFGKASGTAFGLVGRSASLFVSPMKMALEAGTVLAAGLMGVATASIYAAAEDEKLIRRLQAVYGSAEKAESVFSALEIQSVKSGKSTEDMADALIILQQYGLSSSRSLFAVTSAAKVAGSSVEEMAMSVSALQARGLKKFGIELGEKDGQYSIKARDASGKLREVIVKDAEAARKKLIDIFAFKFGLNMQTTTFSGMLEGLKNGLGVAAGQFGDSMKESLKPLLKYLGDELVKLLEGGKIEELGKKAGEWLTKAVDNLLAAMDTMPKVLDGLNKIWEKGGDTLRDFILAAFNTGAGIFADIFVGVLSSSAQIWAAIGEILAATFMNQVLQLPGMEDLRQQKIGEALSSMSSDEYSAMTKKYNIGPNTDFRDIPKSAQAEIGSFGSGKLMDRAISRISGDIPTIMSTAMSSADERMNNLNGTFEERTGINVKGEFQKNLKKRQDSHESAKLIAKEILVARRTVYENVDGNPLNRTSHYEYQGVAVEPGKYRGNEQFGDRQGIRIDKVVVHANHPEELEDAIRLSVSKLAVAAAGT